jgi:large subunit ribosomal protein L17
LTQGLIRAFFLHGKIVTTTHRAKYIRPFVEKLITSAHKANDTGSLADHRLLRSRVQEDVYKKLLDVSKAVGRNGGYTRIIKLSVPIQGNRVQKSVLSIVPKKEVIANP